MRAKGVDLGYKKVAKIGYYPPRMSNWEYHTLITDDVELRKMWDEGAYFNFLKNFIESYIDSIG